MKAELLPHAVSPSTPMGYFTPNDLAKRWDVSPGTVRLWINSGTLDACRFGPKLLRVRADVVEAFELARGMRQACQ
ncbi:MAG: helix-turn-helix domain-containing protein [Janthinobacterium lividum]